MDFSAQKQNVDAAFDGDWIGGLAGYGDFRVRIRSLDCPAARRYQRQLYRAILGDLGSRAAGGAPDEVMDYVTAKTLIEVCVIDWDNATATYDASGKLSLAGGEPGPLPYSREALEAFLLESSDFITTRGVNGAPGKSFKSPDGRRFNYAFRPLMTALEDAARRAGYADEDEDPND